MELAKFVMLLACCLMASAEQDPAAAEATVDGLTADTADLEALAAEELAGETENRDSRDADPSVPAIIIKQAPHPAPLHVVPHPATPGPLLVARPILDGPAHPLPVPVLAEPHANPEYIPPKPEHILTQAKCRIEEVQLTAKLCTPTIEKECQTIRLKTKGLTTKDECLKIVRTVCTEEEEEKDNEVCFFEYNMEDMEAEAKTAEVKYDIRCESTQQDYCPAQQGYGHGYCKKHNTKVCYQEGSVSDVKVPVTLGYPVPNKKCENKPVKLPKVVCAEVEEEKCIPLPYTQEDTLELEKCRAELGQQECQDTVLTLPKQICEEVKEAYHPPSPAPAYHAPAPAYHAPAPAYHAPAPAYQPVRPAFAG